MALGWSSTKEERVLIPPVVIESADAHCRLLQTAALAAVPLSAAAVSAQRQPIRSRIVAGLREGQQGPPPPLP